MIDINMIALVKHLFLIAGLLAAALVAADFSVSRIAVEPALRAACRAGEKIDQRDRRDLVIELRQADRNWFPAVPANEYLERRLTGADATRVVPLGGVANAQVVGCNDSGYFSTFPTDDYGFNNPRAAWEDRSRKNVFFVGDSFTQGDCRRQGESIVDRVRAEVPGVINLGSGGNGPLLELAGIREYVNSGTVAQVVWMYTEANDLEDLNRDMRNDVLAKYLDLQFSQRLQERRDEVNGIVRGHVERLIADYVGTRPLFLPALRKALWHLVHDGVFRQPRTADQTPDDALDIELFGRILSLAKAEVEAKGGEFIFVYLPEYNRYAGQALSEPSRYRERVLALVAQLHIRLVDIEPIIRNSADPLALYPYRQKGHFNPEGAALVAAVIERAIRQ